MKRFATLFVAVGLATAGSTVLAEEAKDQVSKQDVKPQPVQMTEVQLDAVAAGLLTVIVSDVNIPVRVLENANVGVQVPIGAGVGAGVLGTGAGGGAAGAFGRQSTRTITPVDL